MTACLATYAYQFGEWRWEYRLFLDRLETEGHRGPEESLQVSELVQFSEFPNRSSYHVPTNRPAPAIAAAIIVGAACVAAIVWIAVEKPGIGDVFKLLLFVGIMITIGAYKGMLKLTARRDWVTRADFRRLDGTEIFAIWEINATQLEEFDDFLRKLQAVIQSARPASNESPPAAN